MYLLWLFGAAALTVKAYYAAQESNFILFLIMIFMSNVFTLMSKRER